MHEIIVKEPGRQGGQRNDNRGQSKDHRQVRRLQEPTDGTQDARTEDAGRTRSAVRRSILFSPFNT